MHTINLAELNGNTGFGYRVTDRGDKADAKSGQVKNGSVFAGNINNPMCDSIEQKRVQARKQAAKLIQDQFASDNEITDSMNELRARNAEIKKEIGKIHDEQSSYRQEQAGLKERYGIADDSQEQKDLELIRKANNSFKNGRLGNLSKEELKRVANMGELTEYQQRALEYDDIIEGYDSVLKELQDEKMANTATVSLIKRETVKNQGMLKTTRAAEAIMETASDVIKGMLWEDAKQRVDEEMEKLAEAAREQAEKKETEEEKLENIREDKEEQEELAETMQESASDQEKLQSEINKIMKEAELLEEELKGLMVDEAL